MEKEERKRVWEHVKEGKKVGKISASVFVLSSDDKTLPDLKIQFVPLSKHSLPWL